MGFQVNFKIVTLCTKAQFPFIVFIFLIFVNKPQGDFLLTVFNKEGCQELRTNLSFFSRPDGRAVHRETKKQNEKVEEADGEAGGDEEEEKVIFIHYEQRKVMLSQLHPIENGVPDLKTDPPSELRQVKDRRHTKKKRAASHFNFCLLIFLSCK